MVHDRNATDLREKGSTIVSMMTVADLVETVETIGLDPAKVIILSSYVRIEDA